jgi:hypothetical protein
VEEEALTTFMDKKKAEDMENELREIILYSRGMGAWQELVTLRVEIRKQRIEDAKIAKRKHDQIVEIVCVSFLLILGLAALVAFGYFLLGAKNALK